MLLNSSTAVSNRTGFVVIFVSVLGNLLPVFCRDQNTGLPQLSSCRSDLPQPAHHGTARKEPWVYVSDTARESLQFSSIPRSRP